MTRRHVVIPVLVVGAAAMVTACGQGIDIEKSKRLAAVKSNPVFSSEVSHIRHGASLFADRCSGCHTLEAAGTHGSADSIKYRVRTNGPNFDLRKEGYDQVLYAIRNGGFSGAIMPQNVVVGSDAADVAKFLSRFAGTKAKRAKGPTGSKPPG
jgi:mono/diheme cytochrome c family protein